MTAPRTIVQKIWDDHVVTQDPGAPAVLAVDLHLIHEVTSPQAFTGLRTRGLPVRRPGQTVATADHSIPTHDRGLRLGRRLQTDLPQEILHSRVDHHSPLLGRWALPHAYPRIPAITRTAAAARLRVLPALRR